MRIQPWHAERIRRGIKAARAGMPAPDHELSLRAWCHEYFRPERIRLNKALTQLHRTMDEMRIQEILERRKP